MVLISVFILIVSQTIIADFLPGLETEAGLTIRCGGNEFDVHVNRINPGSDGINPEYVLNSDNWNALCVAKNLFYGDVIVFTKVGNNMLNLMAFSPFGRGKTNVQFLGASNINLVKPELDHEEKSEFLITIQI